MNGLYQLDDIYRLVIYSEVCHIDYCIDSDFDFDDSANRGEKEGQERGRARKGANAQANDSGRKTNFGFFDLIGFLYSEEHSKRGDSREPWNGAMSDRLGGAPCSMWPFARGCKAHASPS